MVPAHRFSYFLATGNDPGDLLVCHSCDNPPCCNPAHLFSGTVQDNMVDMVQKGRNPDVCGENHPQHILTEPDVVEIKKRLWSGQGVTEVSRAYLVGVSEISMIKRNRVWQHVPWPNGRTNHAMKSSNKTVPKETKAEILARIQRGERQRDLARLFGLSEAFVSLLKSGART